MTALRTLAAVLVAAAVCPHPPLLVPEVAAGAAGELDDLRAACAEAVRRLLAAGPDVVCIAGGAAGHHWYRERDGDTGSLRAYGVPLDVPLTAPSSTAPPALSTAPPAPSTAPPARPAAPRRQPTLPLSLTIGAWLLHAGGWSGERCAVGLPAEATDDDLCRLGRRIAALAPRVGVLVMGDGSARHSERAPGYVDPRAAAFDAAVCAALAGPDPEVLAGLDRRLGEELLAAGTAPWRLLGRLAAGGDWDAALLSRCAPYGVGYLVATWTRRRR